MVLNTQGLRFNTRVLPAHYRSQADGREVAYVLQLGVDCTSDTKQLITYLLRFHSTRAARRTVGGGSCGAACRAAHSSRWPSRQSARCAALFAAGLYLALQHCLHLGGKQRDISSHLQDILLPE